MRKRGLCLALELRDNALRQRLAQLHTPLIEGIVRCSSKYSAPGRGRTDLTKRPYASL